MSAATVAAEVPVPTLMKINGPRPNKQKAASHAVRVIIHVPRVVTVTMTSKRGNKRAIFADQLDFDYIG
jgi:hypothetical protein